MRICPSVGVRLVTVQFDGMGTADGPPARILGVGVGNALAHGSILAARSSTVEGNVKYILRRR